MKHRLFLSIFALGLVLSAQDASLVLRTSVSYNTQRATLPLNEEQRHEADQLLRGAQQANQAGHYGLALRSLYQGMAVMKNIAWTPAYEFASSLQAKLEHTVVEPGAGVKATLTPLYEAPRAAGIKMNVSLVLVPAQKDSPRIPLAARLALNPLASPFTTRVALPDTPTGDYTIEIRLDSDSEPPSEAARPAFVKSLPLHVDHLSATLARLRERLAKTPKKDGLALAEYAEALYDRADSGEVNPARVNFRQEFAAANAILDDIEAGRQPFAGKQGDFRRAYRSAVDNSLQPYRIFIPTSYDGSKAAPLLVALHGMGGDENSLFDAAGYNDGLLKREAQRVGFLVLCPKGRDTASMYRGSAEQDVLDAMADVQRTYRIDSSRIYLMGHSMGGYGTWSIAMNHSEIFAAIGPISGGGSPAGMAAIRDIPEYVVHGDDDRTVPVTQSRDMVAAGRKAGANIVYVEVPGGSHAGVPAPAFAGMLDFFAKQQKHTAGNGR